MEQKTDKTKDEQQWNRGQQLLLRRRWAKYDGKGPLLLFDTLETAREYARLMGADRHQAWWNHQGPEGPQFVTLEDPGVELVPLELPEGDPEDWPWHPIPFRTPHSHNKASEIPADHSDGTCKTKSGSSESDSLENADVVVAPSLESKCGETEKLMGGCSPTACSTSFEFSSRECWRVWIEGKEWWVAKDDGELMEPLNLPAGTLQYSDLRGAQSGHNTGEES